MNNQLNYIIEQAEDLPVNSLNQCINCGAYLPSDYATKCLICGYDSAEQFECPYKVNKRIQLSNANIVDMSFCSLTKKQCRVQSLDYEICSTFRSLDFLKQED